MMERGLPRVYLAGRMSGEDWRAPVADRLSRAGMEPLFPADNDQTSALGFAAGDLAMVEKSTVVLAYFAKDHWSNGTCVEVGYAKAHKVPVFVVWEDGVVEPLVAAIARRVYVGPRAFEMAVDKIIEQYAPREGAR